MSEKICCTLGDVVIICALRQSHRMHTPDPPILQCLAPFIAPSPSLLYSMFPKRPRLQSILHG